MAGENINESRNEAAVSQADLSEANKFCLGQMTKDELSALRNPDKPDSDPVKVEAAIKKLVECVANRVSK